MRTGNNVPLVASLTVVVAVMIGLVSYSPTLYRMFCAVTGYGGTVNQAQAATPPASTSDREITVRFDANVAPGLDWEFKPAQRSVTVKFGEPTKAYYIARNLSDETVVAQATFNVTPYAGAPYFYKIECFCFTQERLEPGESAEMPLVFYIDEEMLADDEAESIGTMTLSYTFFAQEGLSPEEVAAARDLAGESRTLDASLESGDNVGFANDAPRRR